jgi:uncharacterized damage-inducible protein DinB
MTPTMPENKDALLEKYRAARRELLEVIDGLTDDQLSERTLDAWSVKDHLAHVALWDEVRAAEVERISAGFESAWRMSDEQDVEFNEMGYALREKLSVDQVKWELANSRERLLQAITSATPRGLDPELYAASSLVSDHEQEHTGWIRRWRGERGY